MILSSYLLDVYDRCPRRFAFERTHESRTISPLGLLYKAVEGSLVAADPAQGSRDAIMEVTARLDVAAGDHLSPISAVRHVDAMAEVIALALRARLGKAKPVEPVRVGCHEWQSGLFDFHGSLHRIILASHLDDDSLRSFAHAWQTIGELAALERPITLTAVLVGAQRGGRRHSHWSKGFLHPIQRSLRFGRRRGGADGFTEGWKECWREQSNIKADVWLERMRNDDVLDDLIVSRRVGYSGSDERMRQARADLVQIAPLMETAVDPMSLPMRRSSCDELGKTACPWQAVCFAAKPTEPEDLPHLFQSRGMLREDLISKMCQGRISEHRPSSPDARTRPHPLDA